jgi:hypothetical protein
LQQRSPLLEKPLHGAIFPTIDAPTIVVLASVRDGGIGFTFLQKREQITLPFYF